MPSLWLIIADVYRTRPIIAYQALLLLVTAVALALLHRNRELVRSGWITCCGLLGIAWAFGPFDSAHDQIHISWGIYYYVESFMLPILGIVVGFCLDLAYNPQRQPQHRISELLTFAAITWALWGLCVGLVFPI